jgi:hypothetical protein
MTIIKATPVMYNGQIGKEEVQDSTMDNVLRQASFYCQGSDVFKFFVITKIKSDG